MLNAPILGALKHARLFDKKTRVESVSISFSDQ